MSLARGAEPVLRTELAPRGAVAGPVADFTHSRTRRRSWGKGRVIGEKGNVKSDEEDGGGGLKKGRGRPAGIPEETVEKRAKLRIKRTGGKEFLET